MIEASGATPGTGAIPDQLYPVSSAWAAYRLPCVGANGFVTSREAGVAFEGEPAPTGGANPPAGGDPPKPPADPAPKPPATGAPEPDADGMTTDAGRRALAAERDEKKRLQKELDELRAKTQTEDEKRDASLKAAGGKERDEFWSARLRSTEVRSALRAEGLTNDKDLALAVNASEFASLKVNEDGTIADLAKTITAFKADHPQMFAPPKATGQPTRGPQNGGDPERPKTLGQAIAGAMAPRS